MEDKVMADMFITIAGADSDMAVITLRKE